jgi:serine/threonine protein kinase
VGLHGSETGATDFGRYQLRGLLGRGGMGEVYRAYDTGRDRIVALKLLPPQLAGDADFIARFRRESRLAARLRDPHVVPIHDFGEVDGRLFIDMRLVEGTDLAALLAERHRMEPGRAVHLVGQIAAALDAAHRDGLVHRDVKPSNVLVTEEDHVYLTDFGIAHSTDATALTGTGTALGTIQYMAPERFLQGRGDRRMDVYSLGCLLHEVLTGRRPFEGDEVPAQMYAHVHLPPPRPSALVPGLPPALDDVVVRAMAKDPAHRFDTAGALAAAARVATSGAPVPGGPVPMARPCARPRTSGRPARRPDRRVPGPCPPARCRRGRSRRARFRRVRRPTGAGRAGTPHRAIPGGAAR